MPVYLFTFHAYGSWMPDRRRGFVRRQRGILPTDNALADEYRRRAKFAAATFCEPTQLLAIEELQVAFSKQGCRGHFIATDPSHIHILISWRDERPWQKMRSGLKQSLSRRLKSVEPREWFCEGGSRRRVMERKHFDHLMSNYLPSHRGWKWREGEKPFR
jgi:REP element-mobilizing transposase RayT